jgi:peptidase M50-like protein
VDGLIRCFSAWRVIRAGNREVVEALVAPEHRGPSADLTQALAAWPAAHYWGRPDRSELVLVRPLGPDRMERWLLHVGLFLLTVLCALGAGGALVGSYFPQLPHQLSEIPRQGLLFFVDLVRLPPEQLARGWSFAVPLLGILVVHELGHYIAARRYAINVSPPYFLPVPASVSPVGSLGAFLRLRSPVVDRRQLLDVGAAGPLAGFVVTLAVLAWGYSISDLVAGEPGTVATFLDFAGYRIQLGDSLLTWGARELFLPGAGAVHLSAPAFAGWAGALITGLNLLPLSQLDGGHVAYGLVGRAQVVIGGGALIGLVYLAQFWTPWLVWAGLTLLIGGWRWSHPSVLSPERAIPPSRRWLGWLTAVVLVLTFVPVPFVG